MTEATEFRLYAREAMNVSLSVKDESEKRALIELAFIWAAAAAISEKSESTAPRRVQLFELT
jgi:hypothetical protein